MGTHWEQTETNPKKNQKKKKLNSPEHSHLVAWNFCFQKSWWPFSSWTNTLIITWGGSYYYQCWVRVNWSGFCCWCYYNNCQRWPCYDWSGLFVHVPFGDGNVEQQIHGAHHRKQPVEFINAAQIQVRHNPASMPISTCGAYHNLQQCSRQELSYARVACEERSAHALHVVRSLIVEELKLPDVSEHLRHARPGQARPAFLF